MKQIQTDTLLFTFRFTMQSLQIPDRNINIFYSPRTDTFFAPLFLLEQPRELLFGQLAVTVAVVLVKHQVHLAKIMSVS